MTDQHHDPCIVHADEPTTIVPLAPGQLDSLSRLARTSTNPYDPASPYRDIHLTMQYAKDLYEALDDVFGLSGRAEIIRRPGSGKTLGIVHIVDDTTEPQG